MRVELSWAELSWAGLSCCIRAISSELSLWKKQLPFSWEPRAQTFFPFPGEDGWPPRQLKPR